MANGVALHPGWSHLKAPTLDLRTSVDVPALRSTPSISSCCSLGVDPTLELNSLIVGLVTYGAPDSEAREDFR